MINPYLQARLFELPVRALVIEAEPGEIGNLARLFGSEGIRPRAVINAFSILALPPVPAKWITQINDLPGVRA